MQQDAEHFTVVNVLIPAQGKERERAYRKVDVQVTAGVISAIEDHSSDSSTRAAGTVIDGENRLLLPGFVNAHTHSSEIWNRGEIDMVPLELWLATLIDFGPTDAERIHLSCLHNALETLKSGGTTVVDHLSTPPGLVIPFVETAVAAYRKIGIRAFIAPLIGDLDLQYSVPMADAEAARDRKFPATNTEELLRDMAVCVERFHAPEDGINMMVGPTGIPRCSDELFKGLIELSNKHDLARHTHCLETRAQQILSYQKYNCSVAKHLKDIGFLNERTSCAHCVWLDDEDIKIFKETGTTAVHNALSNLRLGSGIAPILKYRDSGVNVAFGCDGSASNDSQDMLEAIKIGTILHNVSDKDYRNWLRPHESVDMASLGGATALGQQHLFGSLEVGKQADIVLYNLNNLSLLPRTDPIGMLIMGRPTNVVEHAWVRGRRVIADGKVVGVDETWLRDRMFALSDWSLTPRVSELRNSLEPAYRAGMGLPS